MFGIFDSGAGGLSIVNLLRKKFANANFIYLGDTAHFPYGEKSKDNIELYADRNTHFLLKKGAKVIIIACHTASSLAADYLRNKYKKVLIYDVIEPTVEYINKQDFNRIGIIGTRATINSKIYNKKLKLDLKNIIQQSCPLLVSLIEENWIDTPEMFSILNYYLSPFKKEKIDGLVLSCTHYSLIKNQVQKILGPKIDIIDPAEILIEKLAENINNFKNEDSQERFYVTDYPLKFTNLSKAFLGKTTKIKKINLEKNDN